MVLNNLKTNKIMKYRIIIETEKSGKKWYYVQQRFLFYFWTHLNGVCCSTLEQAQEYLQYYVDDDYQKQQSKIIKREIYKKQIRLCNKQQ
jgi:hypothetical protein